MRCRLGFVGVPAGAELGTSISELPDLGASGAE